MVFATYLDKHLQRHYITVHHYMVAIHVAHIALGLPNPLQNCPHLQQLLWAIHHQQPKPQPDSGQQGVTMEFLWQARPLHWLHLSKDSILWATLTLGHHSLFCSGELAQPKLAEAWHPGSSKCRMSLLTSPRVACTMCTSCSLAARWTPSTWAAPSSLAVLVHQCVEHVKPGTSSKSTSRH